MRFATALFHVLCRRKMKDIRQMNPPAGSAMAFRQTVRKTIGSTGNPEHIAIKLPKKVH